MILVQSLAIEEFRGIHKLSLNPGGKNFAVCGPNGTGKSGVVDALEFAITGAVTRLTGQGTSGITLKSHGPHVDMRDKPNLARVVLTAFIPSINKTVTIERRANAPNEPVISPNDPQVLAIVGELGNHPEFALSRREIIKYVLAAPGDRSKEVQALLRLDRVDKVRQSFQTIANSCKTRLKQVNQTQQDTESHLLRALGIPMLKKDQIIEAVNRRRQVLGLDPLTDLGADTSLKAGLGGVAAPSARQKISKTQALDDIAALSQQLTGPEPGAVAASRAAVVDTLQKLQQSPALFRSLRRQAFLRSGLDLFDEAACPFCENEWDLDALRAQVQSRLAEAKEAAELKRALEQAAAPLTAALQGLQTLATAVGGYSKNLPAPVVGTELTKWIESLGTRRQNVLSLEDLDGAITECSTEYRQIPEAALKVVNGIQAAVCALPDPSKEDEARDYLSVAQERLEAYREAKRQQVRAKQESELAEKVLAAYNASSTETLAKIYNDVQKDFSEYYRVVNQDDEAEFEGKLTPSLGKLGFDVDFYGRGFFPPGAYHSEGHQDSMGLCLYLALMKHTLGRNFTFAILDDVLMSVDAGHRREICTLFKTKFPHTQFLMTTHDPIWLQHMVTEQIITSKSSVHFRKWTVDDGPIVWEGGEVWDEIKRDLDQDDVSGAAGTLRRYLEYISGLLSHKLRASIEYRGDAQYDLGELLPAVLAAWKKLLGKAQESANSWNKKEESSRLSGVQKEFSSKVDKSQVEQWAINKSIHYNEWAQLKKQDFAPVVEVFREMLASFRCDTCGGLVYVSPGKGPKESVRCDCGAFNLNLKTKGKG
ncbi:MAG: AAA family ATPase [Nitrospirota bacterium]